MAKRTAAQLDALIRNRMPGYHLSKTSAHAPAAAEADSAPRRQRRRAAADSSTPSIADIRRKYFGASDHPEEQVAFDSPDEEAEIVTVEPDLGDEERRHAKAVVISAEGKILGAQG